jgi:hypothetical protein
MIAAMVILSEAPFVPHGWHIYQIEPIIPMASLVIAHILCKFDPDSLTMTSANNIPVPLALNPGLMTFAW